MNVFVTDGEQRPALAIVRSLARRGATVIVGSEQPVSLASSSKYCARAVMYPSPAADPHAFAEFLPAVLARERIDVVLPVTDVTTHAVCANQSSIRRFSALAVPTLEAFEFVSNKALLTEQASRSGVPVPRTDFVDGLAGVRAVADRIVYPAVVKPCRSRIPTASGWTGAGVHYAGSKAELLELYERTSYLASYPSLIQQRIVGPGWGVFLLCDSGVPIAEFAHRRLREHPPSGGPSVFCESVPVDAVLRDYALRLLAPTGWHGVAMVEFKQDQRTGGFFLMEVNGRFWGSLQLAIDAGVDFPWLACELACGRRPAAAPVYRAGVKSRWLAGDLNHLLVRALKTSRGLSLPENAPSRWRALREFVSFREADLHYDVIDAADPRPFVFESRQQLRQLTASVVELLRRRLGRAFHLRGPRPATYSKLGAPGG